MKAENRRRNKAQSVEIEAEDVDANSLPNGEHSPGYRFFT